ncbi:4876_t:CDS:2 [Ambispora leptoticha]|uniref:4876_t:CDS:1 n=1 Tax=Ambispora leptoticha TaxID=144679 RepID=A0A9N9DHZ6_9GLOM|nr:4876_t:CDS:2 [Ambispora leptoticha]
MENNQNKQKLVTKKISLLTLKEDTKLSEYSKNDEKVSVSNKPRLLRKISLTLTRKKSLSSLKNSFDNTSKNVEPLPSSSLSSINNLNASKIANSNHSDVSSESIEETTKSYYLKPKSSIKKSSIYSNNHNNSLSRKKNKKRNDDSELKICADTREDLITDWNSRTRLDMEIPDEELYIPNQAHTPSQPLFPTFNFPMTSNFSLDSLIVSQQEEKSSSSFAINVFYSDLSYLLGSSNNDFSSVNWGEKRLEPDFTSNQRPSILIDQREIMFNRASVW